MDVLVLRDPRESPAKCSLTPLRGLTGVRFVEYRPELRLEIGERVLLDPGAEIELGPRDRGRDLLLVDCSWRRVPSLLRRLAGTVRPRRLPALVSAYPRRSRVHPDPELGLASVEALFAAALVLGRPRPEFLRHYRWREAFLAANREQLERLGMRPASPAAPPVPY